MIYTLTLNPAFDLHYYLQAFSVGEDNFADSFESEAGGKGINVSRCLQNIGVKSKAFFISGSDNEAEFLRLLDSYGIESDYLTVNGKIRENVSIHSQNADDTRVCVNGFSATDEAVTALFRKVCSVITPKDILVISGRLPHTVLKQTVINLLDEIKKAGVKLFIDSVSFDVSDLSFLKPYFVKPNRYEAKALFGTDDAIYTAQKLFDLGIENACITLGKDGAVYACREGVFTARLSNISPVSTVGAGDAFTAGFAAAASYGCTAAARLKVALACASASTLKKGTAPPELTELLSFYSTTILSKRNPSRSL